MPIYNGGSICVRVCVYVKHTHMFLEGDNTVPWALQQLFGEGALKFVLVIHTEKTARAEKFQDSANYKRKSKNYRLRKGANGSERAWEYRERHQPERPSLLLHHTLAKGAGGYLLLKLCPDGGMAVSWGNVLPLCEYLVDWGMLAGAGASLWRTFHIQEKTSSVRKSKKENRNSLIVESSLKIRSTGGWGGRQAMR